MGSSSSSLESTRVLQTLLSQNAVSPESLTQLLNTDMTEEETRKIFSVQQLRPLRHLYTRNFAALLYRCISAISAVAVKRHELNTSPNPSRDFLTAELITEYHSALRILNCVLPIALESGTTPIGNAVAASQQDNTPAAYPGAGDVMPTPPNTPRSRTAATAHFQKLFFLEGKTCDDANPEDTFPLLPRPNVQLSTAQSSVKPFSLGSIMVWSLVECCFVRGLTLPELPAMPEEASISVTHEEVDTGLMWCQGIATEDPIQALTVNPSRPSFSWASPRLPRERKALLEVLFVALSSPVYHEAGFRDTVFLEPLLSTSTVPLMPTLSVSMLNTILQFVPYGYLPYTSHLGVEEKELVLTSARLLNATLSSMGIPLDPVPLPDTEHTTSDCAGSSLEQQVAEANGDHAISQVSPAASGVREGCDLCPPVVGHVLSTSEVSAPMVSNATEAPSGTLLSKMSRSHSGSSGIATLSQSNAGQPRFVHSVRKMLRDITLTEAKVLVQRMQVIIGVNAYSSQTYLPVSQDWFPSLDDFMMLFWRILDLSPACLAQIGTSSHALGYVIPLLDYGLAVCRSPIFTYQFQLMLFVLTRLSEVRGFVLKGNEVCLATLPFRFPKMSPTRTYNDIIVLALCLIMEMKDLHALVPLFPSCSVVLANMAPFITALGREPSVRLVSIFAQVTYRCLRSSVLSSSGNSMPEDADKKSSLTPGNPSAFVYQSQMVNLCEAIASQLQYQASGSLYLLASLVDHRAVVQEANDAYMVHHTKDLMLGLPAPFFINTLDAAVGMALPVLESTDVLRKTNKYYVNAVATGNSDSSSGVGETMGSLEPPLGTGQLGAGLAESDEAVHRLQSLSLVGVLPTPHSIIIRKFHSTKNIELWAATTFWTSAYIHSQAGLLGDRDSVRLVRFL